MTTEITIASDQDRPNLFAEVRMGGDVIAEVIYDAAKMSYLVQVFASHDDGSTCVDLAEFRNALLQAKEALVARGYPNLTV
ncbi:MAG: hypothetical protein MUF00_04960 [Gemmatimonadaceae bacterium]|jgi:hypothetical protein|nr:hypothetical protein [Gemmatimonadaceae bacterium]